MGRTDSFLQPAIGGNRTDDRDTSSCGRPGHGLAAIDHSASFAGDSANSASDNDFSTPRLGRASSDEHLASDFFASDQPDRLRSSAYQRIYSGG